MDHGSLRAETAATGELAGVCACGWRSPPQESAEAIGHLWDAHRREAQMREAG